MILGILFNDGVRTNVPDVEEWYPEGEWICIVTSDERHFIRSAIVQEVGSTRNVRSLYEIETYANEGPL